MKNIMEKFSLKGKTAVITGGNRGIGRAMTIALAQAGANVAVVDIKIDESLIAEDLDRSGSDYIFIQADVTNTDDCERVVDTVKDNWGKLDIAVNNAGVCFNKEAEKMTPAEWLRIVDLNLNSVFYMSQAVSKEMIAAEKGVIINTSSMSAEIVNFPQYQCSYNATKAGVSHLTKSLAYEWARYNIRVNAVAPGYIATELTKLGMDTEWGAIWKKMTPMQRIGEPDELGGLVVYLASEASSYMTGSVVKIDGGYSIL